MTKIHKWRKNKLPPSEGIDLIAIICFTKYYFSRILFGGDWNNIEAEYKSKIMNDRASIIFGSKVKI